MSSYAYDLHVHTKDTSKCGWVDAVEQVERYKRLGYTGIVITDHLHEAYIQTLDCAEDWPACAELFLAGYRAAKARGDAIGLDVILGIELRFDCVNEYDYLVYGVDEDFLLRNPYPFRSTIAEFYQQHGDETLIIQAHPFRKALDPIDPACLHGIEIVNCNPRHDSHNLDALALARRAPHLIRSVGSDAHRDGDEGIAAVLFHERIHDSFELRRALLGGDFELRCDVFDDIIRQSAGDKK
ncbi:MAG: PHP domain-containing protein [Christensenellaceae bacterium]|nr:PHP domain-containing protein [Christensenellaceae bacterium]